MSALASNPGSSGVLASARLEPPVTGETTLKRLRETRRVQRLLRDLADGKWREIILRAAQGRYPIVKNNSGKAEALLVKLNIIGPALRVHADVLAGEPSSVTSPEGYEPQQAAINAVKRSCLWDTLLHQAIETVNVEGSCAVRAGVPPTPTPGGQSVTLIVEDNEVCFPTGHLGSDQQPTAWERRWVVERPDPADARKTIKVLRVESHWMPEGSPFAAVAQRAYRVESSDPLMTMVGDAKAARPVSLDLVAPGLAELVLLPTPELDIVQLVTGRKPQGGSEGAPPRTRIAETDLDLLDALTASVSRVLRVMELHGDPRLRVTENMMDKATGTFDASTRAVVDPEKVLEYVQVEAQFGEMLQVLDKIVDHVLLPLRMARPLLGMGVKDGALPTTYGELRLNAQTTLTDARSVARYVTPALERVWDTACVMASRLPGGGFDVGPVTVRLSVGLYQGFEDRVIEQERALQAGLTSRWRAVAAVHGDENADAVLAEIEADESRKAELAAKSVMADLAPVVTPGGNGNDNNGGDGSASGDAGGAASDGGVS